MGATTGPLLRGKNTCPYYGRINRPRRRRRWSVETRPGKANEKKGTVVSKSVLSVEGPGEAFLPTNPERLISLPSGGDIFIKKSLVRGT